MLAHYPRRQYIAIFQDLQAKLSDVQDFWLRKKANEMQSFANMKKFHDALKTKYGPKSCGPTTLVSADESLFLIDINFILER